ncbi:MAG: hypothetical protein QG592_924 [Pseudomonadota bacterium]|nr:hypothetical protein [Pseudomonadota bacterium]MDQ5918052.1 hypothetical protein [Pseudomonadota bacterium]MDQ5942908.1 hypothetical protein [Pseudomonadota bacterium]MDQ5959844.1 hypothetical protein [Pseudomonadota bacterium]
MSEAQEKNGQQGAEGSNGSGGFGFWITVSAAAISVGTVILMLLGYGVSLAVEGKFGIPHATVFESGFELLDLASIVFFQLIPAMGKLLGTWQTYRDAYAHLTPFLALMWVAWAAVALWGWRRRIYLKSHDDERTKPTEAERRRSYVLKNAAMLGFIGFAPLFSLFGVFIIQVVMVTLFMIPYVGYAAGNTYIDEQILKPDICMPLIDLKQRRDARKSSSPASQPVAQCVAVKKGGAIVDGRVVFATSKAIVLYRPDGSVQRVPLQDSVIEVVPLLSVIKTGDGANRAPRPIR